MEKYTKGIIEKIKEPVLAVLAAFLISSFIVSHTKVPTSSMMPTINPGDHLIVNRLPYYYRHPKRGEIIVFEKGNERLIKRVIGEPGDVLDIVDGSVYVNGTELDEADYVESVDTTFAFSDSDIIFPYTVPKEYYFVMGDNRKNSMDSRLLGPVSRELIIAKAGLCIFPFNRIRQIK